MYTLDYIRLLHIDVELYNGNPGTWYVEDDHYNLEDYCTDEELQPLTEFEDIDDLLYAIEDIVDKHLEYGYIKRFTVKDSKGEIVGEVEPDYSDY